MCIAFLDRSDKRKMTEKFFLYPDELNEALDSIDELSGDQHSYFCPHLFGEQQRVKENVISTACAWSDLDKCHPSKLLIKPSIIIESSPNRFQGYWLFTDKVDPLDAEDLSRRIAYYHSNDGADKSGWDLTQLLRIPDTFNYKYVDEESIGYPVVKIEHISKTNYRMREFAEYPVLPEYAHSDTAFPTELPQEGGKELLEKIQHGLNPYIVRLFEETPEDGEWSDKLWQLEMLLLENGVNKETTFVICSEAACNKYARDKRRKDQLWKEICRAEESVKFKTQLAVPEETLQNVKSLMTKEEHAIVAKSEHGFVERYIEWASGLGDAAKQYHQAGAFIILSSLLCGSVGLPTSYGTIIPNLWFMILADTTLTRKTTSMDIAMDLLEEVDDSLILATDGSIEGMFTELAVRPRKPSIFLRDEFSGLIESMIKKDYMAGMPETFTKLYDGRLQKRLLRKEVIEVRDPRLLIFAGGIKNRVTGAVTFEHVSSGFFPRFVFITAESDVSKIKPLGPPTNDTSGTREDIIDELTVINDFYNGSKMLTFMGSDEGIEQEKSFKAQLTEEAWTRYNELEYLMVDIGTKSALPEIYTPVGDRLSKSILKAAILIAAARQRNNDETVLVEKIDILKAVKYGEGWRAYAEEIIGNIGKTTYERKLDSIYDAIYKRRAQGAGRSYLMRTFRLTSKDATTIFNTLIERGDVVKKVAGSNVTYYARGFVE